MIGKTIGGYRIIEQIGMGGMATVYKAYDAGMDRYVALKTLPPQYLNDPEFRARFEQEAHAIARLEHAHILPVFAYGEQDGITYLAMRYMETGTLSDLVKKGPLSLTDTARYLSQIASALDYAHSAGIIHRDVKPTNVLVDKHGSAYLTDFGIAKIIGGAANLTGTGAVIGTPQYMSPEQFEHDQAANPASDQYSLAIMAYEMVTGRTPYQAATPWAIIGMHQRSDSLPLPSSLRSDLPPAAENVILKALSRDPALRYESCARMADAFNEAATRAPIWSARPSMLEAPTVIGAADKPTTAAGPPTTRLISPKRSRWPLMAAALIVVAAVVAIGVWASGQDETPPTLPVAAIATDVFTQTTVPQPTATPTDTPTQILTPTPTSPGIEALRDGVPLRLGPAASYSVIGLLNAGDRLEIIGISEDAIWYQVRTLDGLLGWVITAEASVAVMGNLRGVPVALAPTAVPTDTPTMTFTQMPTLTATTTPTATGTFTLTPTHASTLTQTTAPQPHLTEVNMTAAQPPEIQSLLAEPATGEVVEMCPGSGLCIRSLQGGLASIPMPADISGAEFSLGGWSNDGERVVFSLSEDGGNDGFYIINRDGSELRPLEVADYNFVDMVWSPDRRRVAAHASCNLAVVEGLEAGDTATVTYLDRQMTGLECYVMPQWSPDSSQLVVTWINTQFIYPLTRQVRVVDVPSGVYTIVHQANLSVQPHCWYQQAFSPDGEWVAYMNEDCQPQLVRANGSSDAPLDISQFPYWWRGNFYPQWNGAGSITP